MSNKFNTGFAKEYEEELAFSEEQEKLHKKHNIEDENVVVVEKTPVMRYIGKVCRVILTIILWVLATIGLLSIVYPAPRAEMITVWNDFINQITDFFS